MSQCSGTRAAFGLLLAASIGLSACNGASTSVRPPLATPATGAPTAGPIAAAFPTTTQAGRVALPAGSSLTLTSLSAVNSLGRSAVGADGSFTLAAYKDGPQLTTIVGKDGAPLLMGWLGPAATTVDSTSTAIVMLNFATGTFALTHDLRDRAIALIPSLPSVPALAGTIGTALVANPDAFTAPNPTVTSQLKSALSALLRGSQPSAAARQLRAILSVPRATRSGLRSPLGVLISPPNAASGLTPLIDFPSGFHFENALRRPADLSVDRISYVDANGNTVADPLSLTPSPLAIPATNGVGSGTTSTLVDIINGNYAYAPVDTMTTALPLVDGARSTLYRLTAVGPGLLDGAFSQVTAAQHDDQVKLSLSFLVTDFVLPLALSFILPADDIDEALEAPGTADAINDVVTTFATIPAIANAAAQGDLGTALSVAFTQITTSQSAANATFQVALNIILRNAGIDAQQAAFKIASGYMEIVGLADDILAAFDASAVAAGLATADRADIWNVTVTPDNVTLTPAIQTILAGASASLTAAVPSAGGSGAVFAYTWSNTAQFGHLFDGINGHQDNFTSTSASVTYIANAGAKGTDTVGVSVADIQGSGRVPVGTAGATVVVAASPSPTPTPSGVSIAISPSGCMSFGTAGGGQTYTATVTNAPANTTLAYGWQFPTASGGPPGAVTFTDPGSTYNAMLKEFVGPSASASVSVPPDTTGGEANVSIQVQLFYLGADGSINGPSAFVAAHAYFSFGVLKCS